MQDTLTKIPVMLLKNKNKDDRFLAISIEHADFTDPDGDVLLDDIVNAHVIHRADNQPPTEKDIDEILVASNAYIEKMHALFGPDAFISLDFSEVLEKYEPFSTEVDFATFNRISFESEWGKFIGKRAQVDIDDFVMLPPFNQEPTIQNVYLVQEVDTDYIEIEGVRGWYRIPKYEHNFKLVDNKTIKYEFADLTSEKYPVYVSEQLEKAALAFSNGWEIKEALKFTVQDIEFCVTFDFPSATLSDTRAGAKIKDFIIPISINHVDLLRKWVLSEPLAAVINLFENKISPEKFKGRIEALEIDVIKRNGPKPNLNSIYLRDFMIEKREELLEQYRKVEIYSYNSVTLKALSVAEKFTSGETPLTQLGREVTSAEFPRDELPTTIDNGTEVVFEVVRKGKRKPELYKCYFLWEGSN